MEVFAFLLHMLLTSLCTSQTTLCVWNSIETRDHYNGEYTLSQGTQLGKPYWVKTSTSCPSTYYLAQTQDQWGLYWSLSNKLQTSYDKTEPYCSPKDNPSLCTSWHWWWNANENGILDMNVYAGNCPSLQCNSLRISGTGHQNCNGLFYKDTVSDNIYKNAQTYIYFNKQTFRWYCSSTLAPDECDDDDTISHFYISSDIDSWFDVNIDETVQWTVNNGNTATIECVGPTQNPTSSPLNMPTLSPIPTVSPTQNPLAPTQNPSVFPTKNPSLIPSENPSLIPTETPSLIPSENPFSMPSQNPSLIPTENPSLIPSQNPLIISFYPSVAPTQFPSVVDKEHSVDDDYITTVSSLNIARENSGKQDVMSILTKHSYLMLILGGTLLIMFILVICFMIAYCRHKRKQQKREYVAEVAKSSISHINLSNVSVQMSPTSGNGNGNVDFAAADTPHLNALNSTMKSTDFGEIKKLDLTTPGGENMDVFDTANGNDNEGSMTDDELYSPPLTHQITLGAPDVDVNIYQNNITPMGDEDDDDAEEDNYDEIYSMPDPNEIITRGMDDDDLLDEDDLVALPNENVDNNQYKD